jgi:hypothetical protein
VFQGRVRELKSKSVEVNLISNITVSRSEYLNSLMIFCVPHEDVLQHYSYELCTNNSLLSILLLVPVAKQKRWKYCLDHIVQPPHNWLKDGGMRRYGRISVNKKA